MSGGHDHGTESMSDARLVWAVVINVALTAAQVVGGVVSGSLSLVADALHNLSDAASLGIALYARKIGRRPADKLMTFGYQRGELIAALINLTSLLIVGGYLLIEAVDRFFNPQPIAGWIVIGVASVALVIDIVTALLVYSSSKHSLNMKAAFLHNVSDAAASLGVIVAGALILLYDWLWADLVITVAISAYVIWQGVSLLPRTIRLLMGAVPDDVEFDAIAQALASIDGVREVHHVHVWSISEHERSLECHLVPDDPSMQAFEGVKIRVRTMVAERFAIGHATLEACVADDCETVDSHGGLCAGAGAGGHAGHSDHAEQDKGQGPHAHAH